MQKAMDLFEKKKNWKKKENCGEICIASCCLKTNKKMKWRNFKYEHLR
jgi:hypothetical protein